MKILFYLLLILTCYYFCESVQPYFPNQIVFSSIDGLIIIAIDEVNQQAYKSIDYSSTGRQTSYAMKNMKYPIPDSPESKYYVQLSDITPMNVCQYATYWKYGGSSFNAFPTHWDNGTSFEIKNYMKFNSEMIHSNNSSIDEDYWYSNETCKLTTGEIVPCEEIYFKKNTDIPLRFVQVFHQGPASVQITTEYTIISMGKPDDKYFDSLSKNWSLTCRDINLGISYNPRIVKINLNETAKVQVWLSTPPHRIHGNDTVRMQWNANKCKECFTISPNELVFNIDNFQETQTLTITRIKDVSGEMLIPSFYGGGFDLVSGDDYPIIIN